MTACRNIVDESKQKPDYHSHTLQKIILQKVQIQKKFLGYRGDMATPRRNTLAMSKQKHNAPWLYLFPTLMIDQKILGCRGHGGTLKKYPS